jgi:peptidoglycan/LPS O-acetylase OafA/YrhL
VSETLASYSYSLYLVHYPIMVFILLVFKLNDDIVGFIVLLVVSNIVAYLFARIFEANSKSWRLKYENYRRNKN